MRVLLIGFGPFPGASFNPSAVLVKTLVRRRRPALATVVRKTHVFATTYAAVDRDLPKLFAQKPDVILMFGLAGRRRELCDLLTAIGDQKRLPVSSPSGVAAEVLAHLTDTYTLHVRHCSASERHRESRGLDLQSMPAA